MPLAIRREPHPADVLVWPRFSSLISRLRPHVLHGRSAVVTHDAPYLLRCPQDKAKAWDDLCRAMRLAARQG